MDGFLLDSKVKVKGTASIGTDIYKLRLRDSVLTYNNEYVNIYRISSFNVSEYYQLSFEGFSRDIFCSLNQTFMCKSVLIKDNNIVKIDDNYRFIPLKKFINKITKDGEIKITYVAVNKKVIKEKDYDKDIPLDDGDYLLFPYKEYKIVKENTRLYCLGLSKEHNSYCVNGVIVGDDTF